MERRDENGIALLLVLWVLTVLMVLVLSFSFLVRTETQASLAFREGVEKKFLAEAGIERGIMEIFYRKQNKGIPAEEGKEVWRTDGTPYTDTLGSGSYSVKVFDESGKVNINAASDIILKHLFINLGVPAEAVDTIVDSIMDWKDADDLLRLHGAESDYYSSLPNPYDAKNANFDTLEELLLVKGVTSALLYGSGEMQGAIEFLTASPDNLAQVNVNAAPREVLLAVPGITPEIVEVIISLRQDHEIANVSEIPGIQAQSLPHLSAGGGSTFAVEAIGIKDREQSGYAVRAMVSIEGANKFKYISYKSPSR